MKKFVTAIPLQAQGKLERKHYKAVGNPRLDMEETVSFPILTAFQGYVNPGEHSQIIAIRTDSENARRNFSILEQETAELCRKRGIPYPDIVVIDVPEDETVTTHVATFRQLIDRFSDGDELFGCLTYGTKPLSEVVRMSIQYAYRVKKNASICCVVYGQIIRDSTSEAKDSLVHDETALLRLDEIVRLLADQGVENPSGVLDALLAL